jgi:hypothetical protein
MGLLARRVEDPLRPNQPDGRLGRLRCRRARGAKLSYWDDGPGEGRHAHARQKRSRDSIHEADYMEIGSERFSILEIRSDPLEGYCSSASMTTLVVYSLPPTVSFTR